MYSYTQGVACEWSASDDTKHDIQSWELNFRSLATVLPTGAWSDGATHVSIIIESLAAIFSQPRPHSRGLTSAHLVAKHMQFFGIQKFKSAWQLSGTCETDAVLAISYVVLCSKLNRSEQNQDWPFVVTLRTYVGIVCCEVSFTPQSSRDQVNKWRYNKLLHRFVWDYFKIGLILHHLWFPGPLLVLPFQESTWKQFLPVRLSTVASLVHSGELNVKPDASWWFYVWEG